jgi:hypothetical protein
MVKRRSTHHLPVHSSTVSAWICHWVHWALLRHWELYPQQHAWVCRPQVTVRRSGVPSRSRILSLRPSWLTRLRRWRPPPCQARPPPRPGRPHPWAGWRRRSSAWRAQGQVPMPMPTADPQRYWTWVTRGKLHRANPSPSPSPRLLGGWGWGRGWLAGCGRGTTALARRWARTCWSRPLPLPSRCQLQLLELSLQQPPSVPRPR